MRNTRPKGVPVRMRVTLDSVPSTCSGIYDTNSQGNLRSSHNSNDRIDHRSHTSGDESIDDRHGSGKDCK